MSVYTKFVSNHQVLQPRLLGLHYNVTSYFGTIIGRVANRIDGAQFNRNGTLYKLHPSEGKNRYMLRKYAHKGSHPYITLSYFSDDSEEGFPGPVLGPVTDSQIKTKCIHSISSLVVYETFFFEIMHFSVIPIHLSPLFKASVALGPRLEIWKILARFYVSK
uniref:Uncharacterized protein n=1 Tax=Solanum lycopersicum TaxID=4081 RepID=A0A3Q7G1D2_SOLLC